MNKLLKFILPLLLIVGGINPVFAQVPERSRLVVPSSTSGSWFRAAATPINCSAPQFSFIGQTTDGWSYGGSDTLKTCINGSTITTVGSTGLGINASPGVSGLTLGGSNSIYFSARSQQSSPAAGQMNFTNNAETAGVGLDFATDASLKIRTRAQSAYANLDAAVITGTAALAGPGTTASSGDVRLANNGTVMWRNSSASTVGMRLNGSDVITWDGGASYPASYQLFTAGSTGTTVKGGGILETSAADITVGSGTGVSVIQAGALQRQVYKVTVDRTAFVCAAVTCDVTIATFPTKTEVLAVYADLTQTFACTATCTSSTLSMTAGNAAGNNGFLVSFDIDAAIALFGDADAELGTLINRANAVQAGYITSFGSTTPLSIRLTSGTGNIGNGSATNLSQGSLTFYVVTERLP